jgi:hypothetical protein
MHYSCAYFGRFVGWITEFIRQRHRAAASCAYSYARMTFTRRMPPLIRARLQNRQKRHTMNTSMRGFIAAYTHHTGRGTELLAVSRRTKRNSRILTEHDHLLLPRYT